MVNPKTFRQNGVDLLDCPLGDHSHVNFSRHDLQRKPVNGDRFVANTLRVQSLPSGKKEPYNEEVDNVSGSRFGHGHWF